MTKPLSAVNRVCHNVRNTDKKGRRGEERGGDRNLIERLKVTNLRPPEVVVVLPVSKHLSVRHQLLNDDWLATRHVPSELQRRGRDGQPFQLFWRSMRAQWLHVPGKGGRRGGCTGSHGHHQSDRKIVEELLHFEQHVNSE